MDDGEERITGSLYCLADGELRRRDTEYCITNGPTASPDGKVLYHTDTLRRIIYAFDIADDGSLQNKRVFTTFAEALGYPDGSITDAEGFLWTGMYGGGCILRHSPSGALVDRLPVPCSNITKAAFGDSDLRTIYLTTARKGLSAEQLAKEPLAGSLFALRVGVSGIPQHYARLDGMS